ncbi:MAG: hypothetical protein ABW157_05570 [Candidatus Thiodiazotropha sp. LLP2]
MAGSHHPTASGGYQLIGPLSKDRLYYLPVSGRADATVTVLFGAAVDIVGFVMLVVGIDPAIEAHRVEA